MGFFSRRADTQRDQAIADSLAAKERDAAAARERIRQEELLASKQNAIVSTENFNTVGTTTTFGQAIIINPIIPDALGSTPGVDIVAGAGFDVSETGVTEVQGTLADGIAISPGVVTVAGGTFPTTTETGVTEVQGTLADGVASGILLKDSMDKAQGIVQLSANDPVLKALLLDAKRADLTIALKSQMSPDLEFNTLQVPEPDARFVYQRWSRDETDLVSQEDPTKDPLLTEKLNHVPRYIEFQWNMIGVTEQTTENKVVQNPETQALKNAAFVAPRGIDNSSGVTTQLVDKSLKTLNTVKSDTVKGKIVDIHEPLRGFGAVSNKHEFGNSILTTINVVTKLSIDRGSILK